VVIEHCSRRCCASAAEAGLVGGRRLVVDATHIEADAALKSLRAELSLVPSDGDDDAEVGQRPRLALAEPRSGPTPKRTASNVTAVSRSDPDGKLRHKPGHRTHLVHRGQVAVDPKRRVIVAVQVERATGSEADALQTLIRRVRFAGHSAAEVAADAGYASQDAYATLDALGATALIPPQTGRASRRGRGGARACAPRPAATPPSIAKRTPKAPSPNSSTTVSGARCRGTRLVQLQMLAAATAITLKRLLSHQDALGHDQTGDPCARLAHDPLAHRPTRSQPERDRPPHRGR
jgi:hypothetical protein